MNRLWKSSVLLAAFIAAANAQTLDKKSLSETGAQRAIRAALALANQRHTTGVIAVVDDGGNLMAVDRIDGTFPAGANISIGKARTAALFLKPSRVFEDIIAKGRTAMVALNDFTPFQGGVPIIIDGQIVGAVGVSGAASAAEDAELAEAGAAAFKDSPAVSFFDHATVDESFAKGSVLFNNGSSYMVHTSRREKAGQAEIHAKDADIIYALDGTATIVTGGVAVNMKTVAPDEIRGSEITGGETHQLVKGDVLIIPAGVPHWFREVTNPFLYYVVKAR